MFSTIARLAIPSLIACVWAACGGEENDSDSSGSANGRDLLDEVQDYDIRCQFSSRFRYAFNRSYESYARELMRSSQQIVPQDELQNSRIETEEIGIFSYSPQSFEELDRLRDGECYGDFRFPAYSFRNEDVTTICQYLVFLQGLRIIALGENLTDPGDHHAEQQECAPAIGARR